MVECARRQQGMKISLKAGLFSTVLKVPRNIGFKYAGSKDSGKDEYFSDSEVMYLPFFGVLWTDEAISYESKISAEDGGGGFGTYRCLI